MILRDLNYLSKLSRNLSIIMDRGFNFYSCNIFFHYILKVIYLLHRDIND
jgi:hypothetical protein